MLPEKSDPDDLLCTNGIEALKLCAQKHLVGQLLLESLLPNSSSSSTQEKIRASKHIFELLSHLKSEIAQEDYLQEVSKNAQISMQSLTKDFVEFKKLKARQSSYQNNLENKTEPNKQKIEDSPLTQTHWELLYLTLKFPEYGKQIAYTIDSDSIHKKSLTGKFLSKLLAEFYETTNISVIRITYRAL